MKRKQLKPSREAKGKTAAAKHSLTTGDSTAASANAGKEPTPPIEPVNHEQYSGALVSPKPALGILITDTDVVVADEPDSGELNSEPLTAQEELDLRRCEIRIEERMGAWLEMATDLSEVKAKRLYRATHRSFKEYLAKRWNISPAQRAIGLSMLAEHWTERLPRETPPFLQQMNASFVNSPKSPKTSGPRCSRKPKRKPGTAR